METVKIKPFTPMRPANGGRLEIAPPKFEGEAWAFEPKYNGWRVLLHCPSGEAFNRHGERLSASFARELAPAFAFLRESGLEWADCEALSRRHAIGKGALILLDAPSLGGLYWERMERLEEGFSLLPLNQAPERGSVSLPPFYPWAFAKDIWESLKEANKLFSCDFFEGIVAKKLNSQYEKGESQEWVKHRFV